MDLVSHIVFACLLNFGRVDFWLILGSILPDFDKVFTYPKRKFRGCESRTFFTELPMAAILIPVSFFFPHTFTIGLVSHYLLDFLTGETRPFNPFVRTVVDFELPLRYKALLGCIMWVIGGVLVGRWLGVL